MIQNYKSKGLKELFQKGTSKKIDPQYHARCREILDVINRANTISAVNQPGYFLHPLKYLRPMRWAVEVNGPWRITFEFHKGDAYRVDYEQYH